LLGALLLSISLTSSVLAAPAEKVVFYPGSNNYLIDDSKFTMDAVPFITSGTIYVPVRFLANALGAEDKLTKWDKSTGKVSLFPEGNKNFAIILQTGKRQLVTNYLDAVSNNVINSKTVLMDVAPVLRNDRLYLPARWAAEACGFAIKWDSKTQSVQITTADKGAPAGGVSVTTREIKSKTDQLELDLKLPVINGLVNKVLQEKINNAIYDQTMQVKSELESSYAEYAADAKKFDFTAHPFQLYVNYEVHTGGQVLSLVVQTYQFTGGAHGMSWKNYYNLDTQNSRQLAMQELFKAEVDYISIINAEIKKQIQDQITNEQGMYFEGAEGFTTIAANHPFYIKDQHLVICFGQYEIAPYAAGMPEFKLPIDVHAQQWAENFIKLLP